MEGRIKWSKKAWIVPCRLLICLLIQAIAFHEPSTPQRGGNLGWAKYEGETVVRSAGGHCGVVVPARLGREHREMNKRLPLTQALDILAHLLSGLIGGFLIDFHLP